MSDSAIARPEDLPLRKGPPPRVYPGPPQHQLDQLPLEHEWQAMRQMFDLWRTAERGASQRAVPGTASLYVPASESKATNPEAFLLGSEFAHHHPNSDGGLHLVLPPDWHAAALNNAWAIPHTFAGRPTVSQWTVLVFAPRNEAERKVVERLVQVAEAFARGAAI